MKPYSKQRNVIGRIIRDRNYKDMKETIKGTLGRTDLEGGPVSQG